jgi:SEC-C motif domain protein
MNECPCRVLESEKIVFDECCGPYISGQKKAPTAEALMRSRYVAYVLKNVDYIGLTQFHEKFEEFNKEETLQWAQSSEWKGMEIKSLQQGSSQDNEGVVEFVAHYQDKSSGADLKHHETSLFRKQNDEWKFISGRIHGIQPLRRLTEKLGRNDPCHCGSGKKFKKCHGV